MKAELIITAALLSMPAMADEWTGRDKHLHFAGGAAIAAAVTAATHDEWLGFAAGAAVGIAKEIADEQRYGGASGKDAAVTALGALVGAKFAGWALMKNGVMFTRTINVF